MVSYLQYELIPVIGLIVSIVFTMTFPFIQESPFYYIRKGHMPGFEKSLRWFRGIRNFDDRNNSEFERELYDIKQLYSDKNQVLSEDTSNTGSIRRFIAGLIFTAGAQLSGVNVILFYGPNILKAAGAVPLTTDTTVLILAATHVIGSILAKWMSGTISRRVSNDHI